MISSKCDLGNLSFVPSIANSCNEKGFMNGNGIYYTSKEEMISKLKAISTVGHRKIFLHSIVQKENNLQQQ